MSTSTRCGHWKASNPGTGRQSTAPPSPHRNPVPSLTANREGANSARLHWEPPASGQPYRYIIQSKAKNQQSFNYLATASGYVTTRRVEVGYDQGYTFRVLAQNHVGVNGPHQEGVTAAATVPAQEHQGDQIPRNINARMLDNATVLLTWNAPQRTGHQVDSYRIYRKPVSDTRRLGDSYDEPRVGGPDRQRQHQLHRPHGGTGDRVRVRRGRLPQPVLGPAEPNIAPGLRPILGVTTVTTQGPVVRRAPEHNSVTPPVGSRTL